MVGAWFAFTPSKPPPDPAIASSRKLSRAKQELDRTKTSASLAEADLRRRIWDIEPEELGSRVMETLTRLSEKRKILVANFQTGRLVTGAGLRQVPFGVTLEGAYNDVIATMEELEGSDSKLAVKNVSLTPNESDGSAGRVSATLTLTAFLREREEKK